MKLYIDTTDRKNTHISIIKNDDSVLIEKINEENASPESVLGLIDKGLKELNLKIKDIKEIEVEKGPGSYTGTRVGIAVANALSLALGISVNKKPAAELEAPKY